MILTSLTTSKLIHTDPFTITHPTAVQTSLFSVALFARFDPTGRYIGAGRIDGSAVIWDLETRSPVRWLEGHVKAVTSIEYVFLFFAEYPVIRNIDQEKHVLVVIAVGQDIPDMC